MSNKLKVVLFMSRNKDNTNIKDFKERTRAFLTDKSVEGLNKAFSSFVNKGQLGEMSRFYISVNNRDNIKVNKALLHHLIDSDEFNMSNIENKTVSLASRKENRRESKWLFDFDDIAHNDTDALSDNDIGKLLHNKLLEFLKDLEEYISEDKIKVFSTPNGYAVIVDHGFDTRELLSKWDNVTLKRDGLLCYNWVIAGSQLGYS